MNDFQECPSCAAKPGTPILCSKCLKRRSNLLKSRESIKPPDMRAMTEANYQYAKHCVSSHDDLLAACELMAILLREPDNRFPSEYSRAEDALLAAITKATHVSGDDAPPHE